MWSRETTRVAISVVAGAAGFTVGFYAGLRLGSSIWGLNTGALWIPALTAGLGSVLAGLAIALTVSDTRRWAAIVTAVALGAMLVLVVVAVEAGVVVTVVGGLALVAVTAVVSRAGPGNALLT